MTKERILTILYRMRQISPNKDFSQKSKFAILQTPHDFSSKQTAYVQNNQMVLGLFIQKSFRAVFLAGATIAILFAIYFATAQLSPLFLPGLNQNGIIAEADMINTSIDIQLSNIQKFDATTKQSITVLQEITANTPDHLSEEVIKSEQEKIELPASTQTDDQINSILKAIGK